MALITSRDAAFAYEGNVVVDGLTFAVNRGDYLCVVGENGSGKSTLMKGILGLMRPKSGTIETGDGLHPTQIGYLPQQSSAQKDFPASVYEVVISGRLSARGLMPFYGRKDHKIAQENIEKLGITPIRKKNFRELSGGQQQRALLARALCATEKVLLLDEPVSGLDPLVTAELYQAIDMLHREAGITIIMISHDIHAAVKHATHILHLQNKQLFFGTTEEYKQTDVAKQFWRGGDSV